MQPMEPLRAQVPTLNPTGKAPPCDGSTAPRAPPAMLPQQGQLDSPGFQTLVAEFIKTQASHLSFWSTGEEP